MCRPAKASEYQARKEQELLQLNLRTWPALPPTDQWQVRYWDSLTEPIAASQGMAQAVLDLLAPLQVPTALPDPQPSEKQRDGWSCGLYTVHHAEREIRKFLGEVSVAAPVSLKDRLQRIAAVLQEVSK